MRFAAVLTTTLLAGACLLAVPQAAFADPATVTLASSAVGPRSGAATAKTAVLTVKATVADAPVENAVFTATLPGDVGVHDVTFDGGPTEPGAVTVQHETGPARTEVTANVGFGADASQGGELVEGETYPITVTTALSADIASPAATSATLAYDDGGSPATQKTSATLPLPDLRVAPDPDFGSQQTLNVAPGGNALYFVDVTPRGGTVTASELTVTLPTGLAIQGSEGIVRLTDSEDDDASLTCTRSGATLHCPLGKITETTYVAIALRATSAARPGTSGSLVVAARAANDLDATPADNTARATVRFVPPARLRTRLTADHTSVEIGDEAHVTVSVTNTGTSPADVFGITLVVDKLSQLDDDDVPDVRHFKITGFSGRQGIPNTIDPTEGSGGGSASSDPVVAARAMISAAKRTDPNDILRFWNIGTLAPGATAKAVLTLEAEHTGRGVAAAIATGSLSGSTCLLENADHPSSCPEYGQLSLRAVAGAGTSGNGAIAATGFATTQWTGLALALLLLGALSQYTGVRRLRVSGRHRS